MAERRAGGWVGWAVVVGVIGTVAAVWLLAHPESPVLVYAAMVGFAVFALLAVVMSVVWVVQQVRDRAGS